MFKFLKGNAYARVLPHRYKNAGFYGTTVNKKEVLFPQA